VISHPNTDFLNCAILLCFYPLVGGFCLLAFSSCIPSILVAYIATQVSGDLTKGGPVCVVDMSCLPGRACTVCQAHSYAPARLVSYNTYDYNRALERAQCKRPIRSQLCTFAGIHSYPGGFVLFLTVRKQPIRGHLRTFADILSYLVGNCSLRRATDAPFQNFTADAAKKNRPPRSF